MFVPRRFGSMAGMPPLLAMRHWLVRPSLNSFSLAPALSLSGPNKIVDPAGEPMATDYRRPPPGRS